MLNFVQAVQQVQKTHIGGTVTERVNTEALRSKFRDFIDAIQKGLQVIVLRHGKPVAVLISYEKWLEMGGKEQNENKVSD